MIYVSKEINYKLCCKIIKLQVNLIAKESNCKRIKLQSNKNYKNLNSKRIKFVNEIRQLQDLNYKS